ncbi:hypothetical protein HNP48_004692 [Acidovorax soli]|uniref:Uncharacterized protein n=1 Tax=Acidovorax soli TaxID=592050 RepID=A0A7X0UBW8_9BURK|nr:hypothetical protein [Acidovorax soli]MBB6561990.1 hypothetical protein [Acidovorax soli]
MEASGCGNNGNGAHQIGPGLPKDHHRHAYTAISSVRALVKEGYTATTSRSSPNATPADYCAWPRSSPTSAKTFAQHFVDKFDDSFRIEQVQKIAQFVFFIGFADTVQRNSRTSSLNTSQA